MIRIEQICEKISNNISDELNFDNDKKAVINYGLFAFIQMGFCLILVMIFGVLFNVFYEALIISFTSSILRKSSGGVHASSPMKCAIIGTISSVGLALISKYVQINSSINVLIGSITFIWSYYILYKLAPVDCITKPIKNIEKRKKLKKHSIMILSIYLIIILIHFLFYYFVKNPNLLIFCLCIYMGILWQVFSLTQKGHLLILKIDKLIY